MKNRVGILTFHRAHNYGAMLQAYALCEIVNEMGADCEIIDYKCKSIDRAYHKEDIISTFQRSGIADGIIDVYKRLQNRYYWDIGYLRFKKFLKHHLKTSNYSYKNINEMVDLPYDTYIFGSDQIWNKKLTKGLDPVYFGKFVPSDNRKIAYAASAGNGLLDNDDKIKFKNMLSDFHLIGVREQQLKNEIQNLGLQNTECVLDPTLLLNPERWKDLIAKKPLVNGNYILVYQVKKNKRAYNIAKKIADQTGYKIVEINLKYDPFYKFYYSDDGIKQLWTCGPKEFLNLFYHSKYVVTTSFHGTCFSIIFNKQFYYIPSIGIEGRCASLLNILDLENRIVKSFDDFNFDDSIAYEKVNQILEKERKRSYQLLKSSLNT